MIIEQTDINVGVGATRVTRVCDECGKKEQTNLKFVRRGRFVRHADIDLCWHCANNRKYRKMPRGNLNGQWQHGISSQGYRRITVDEGRRVLEHVFVVEKNIKRRLDKGETIHHIDFNKLNNDVTNLFLYPDRSGHLFCHWQLESLLCSLLNKYIFFDYNNGLYVTIRPTNINPKLKLILTPEQKDYLSDIKQYLYCPRSRTRREMVYYVYDRETQKNKSKKYHVLVASTATGRKLYKNEDVHHIDSDATHNDINNICVMTKSDHHKCHTSLITCAALLYKQGLIGFDREKGIYYLKQIAEIK